MRVYRHIALFTCSKKSLTQQQILDRLMHEASTSLASARPPLGFLSSRSSPPPPPPPPPWIRPPNMTLKFTLRVFHETSFSDLHSSLTRPERAFETVFFQSNAAAKLFFFRARGGEGKKSDRKNVQLLTRVFFFYRPLSPSVGSHRDIFKRALTRFSSSKSVESKRWAIIGEWKSSSFFSLAFSFSHAKRTSVALKVVSTAETSLYQTLKDGRRKKERREREKKFMHFLLSFLLSRVLGSQQKERNAV